jgi:Ca2+-binding RTX toxin-like protein
MIVPGDNTNGAGSNGMINSLTGGSGNDTFFVDNTGDKITEQGGGGNDTVLSSVTYTLSDNVEMLVLMGSGAINGTGNSLNNFLMGNSANNILNGSTGADTMIGNNGDDTYYVDNIGDRIIENASGGIDTVVSTISWKLGENIENLTLSGTAAIDGTGNSANNILIGNSANNILIGGDGNDTIVGGDGNDTMDGGNGIDLISYYNAGSAVDINLGIATAQNTLGAGTDTIVNIEYLEGSRFNDNLIGNASVNMIYGGDGNDSISGGLGNDTLVGGNGADTFVFNTALNASSNVDTINDFVAVDDTIQLSNAIFTALTSTGTLSAANFVASATGAAVDSNDYILYNTTTGALYYDADGSGSGAAVEFAVLGTSTHSGITNIDFLVA